MGWEAWFVIAVVLLVFGILAFTRWATDIVLMGGVTVLMLAGILTPDQALAGFANTGMITVATLFIVSAALRETGAVYWIAQYLFGKPRSVRDAQWRMMAPVASLSAFLNNTPLVAMMIPAVSEWAKKHQVSPSKLMIPLTYAASVGGMCTLIGTSTNLVVNSLLENEPAAHGAGLHLFELMWIGVPCVVITIVFVILTSRWLLPERRPVLTQLADAKQYTVEMMVDAAGPLVRKSVEEAGLRQLPGLYLIEIERNGQILPAVASHEKLQPNDRLVFAGLVESIVDLHKIRGLAPATTQVFKLDAPRPERCLMEAVVSDSCPIVGMSIREGRFRTLYNAAVIAVARNGEQIRRKIGDIILRPGDTLLLEGHPSFVEQQRNSRDFLLVSQIENSSPPRHERAGLSLAILVGMVALASSGVMSMLQAAMLAAGILLITRCITGGAARKSIDMQVLVVIAAAFAIGQALESSGAAKALAGEVIAMTAGHPLLALAMLYLVSAVLTELLTNNAAAVLAFPIGMAMAESLGVNFMPFVITIMIAASASFATPIGYQTNLMVMGPGGYHFMDYVRIGVPLTILVGGVTVGLVPLIWPF